MEQMNYWVVPTFQFAQLPKEDKEKNLIIKVCNMYDVTPESLNSKTRKRKCVEARYVIFYILHKICRYSQQETGDIFGKDHATVLYGCKTIIDFISIDKQFEAKIERLIDYTRYSFKIEKLYLETGVRKSKYTGVSWSSHAKKWRAGIFLNGKNKQIGYFTSEYEAYLEYQKVLTNKK
jgi:hypothetical protein